VPFSLSKRSLKSLEGVHPDLVAVVKEAITLTTVDFVVIEGRRTLARQKELVAKGASWTMNSRHLTGHAVDLAAWLGTIRWEAPLYDEIHAAMQAAGKGLGVPIEWGGLWKSRDCPHFQLPRGRYPG